MVEQVKRSQQIDRDMEDERKKLQSQGVRSIEDKNWESHPLGQRTYYLHGTKTAPRLVRKGGLDPSYGREQILVQGSNSKRFILAFPALGNQIPETYKFGGAAKFLWSQDDFQYVYVFHVDAGTTVYYSGERGETGFSDIIPWSSIDRVFCYDTQKKEYNPLDPDLILV
jgi:hypothetical protein